MLIEVGQGVAKIENQTQEISSGMLVNLPIGTVHGFSFQPGTQGWVVTVASELMDSSLRKSEGLQSYLQKPIIVESSEEIRRVVLAIFAEYPNRIFARAHILRALCGVLVGQVARKISLLQPQSVTIENGLRRRFETMLEEHFLEHLSVAEYAQLLSITPTHLSRVLRASTGQPASAIIENRIVREARRNLAFSNLTITEISYQLGYEDPSYFSRVFKRVTGQSPRDYRRKLEH
ncbi:MAG: AraC family transcriptional regulator [Paracoccaceae bacterium]|nr:AraC family transcriptional regulator [Paracoccaceae bacterium]MDG2257415.1 AraC family transcriptional regulator [Paracoccaceae bacterium]